MPNRRRAISNHRADYSIQYITATSNDRHGVSKYRPIDCLFNSLFRLTTKTSKVRVTVPLWGETSLTGCFPAQKDSEAEDFLFDDVIMDKRYHDGKCIILRNMHIASQPLNKQWSIEVGMSSSRRFLCYRWVHYLRTITLCVKNFEWLLPGIYHLLGVEGGRTRWQRDYLKILQGKLLKFWSDLNRIWRVHKVGVWMAPTKFSWEKCI